MLFDFAETFLHLLFVSFQPQAAEPRAIIYRTDYMKLKISHCVIKTIRPLKGLIRPFKGLVRPLKGLVRPFKGLIRLFKGLIRHFRAS